MTGTRTPLLGVDTGGTYTDAVIYDEMTQSVLGSAKAETTHDDLAVGIDKAIADAIDAAAVSPAEIALVSMSTTLATNALVENTGRAACLVTIGFEPESLDRAGLREALGTDEVILVEGGHTSHGAEVAMLDLEALATKVSQVAPHVDAFAITAQFSVRNPSHELAARDLITDLTGKPVTCSHYLSANLNGPKRAVTALLNARLIAMIRDLVTTTIDALKDRSIGAPLMVVRGDGSLVSADFVLDRPIETILSGPAASLVGAAHLVGTSDAVIADIGGTTTDIAVLRGGEPELGQDGATVGGHRTMVEAVAMHTHGIGGDSQVHMTPRPVGPELVIGPRRVLPVSLLATHAHDVVHEVLDRQLEADLPSDLDGVLVTCVALDGRTPQFSDHEKSLITAIGDRLVPADALITSSVRRRALDRLVSRGLVRASGFTPTDASHVLGIQSTYDVEAARKAAELFARQRDRYGKPIAATAESISESVVTRLVRRSAEVLIAATLIRDGMAPELTQSPLVAAALDRSAQVTRIDIGVDVPVIGLGAPAATYYPAVAALLGTESIIPAHAEVANAVGAVVGRIRILKRAVISAPRRGFFRVHVGAEPPTFTDLEEAKDRARQWLRETVGSEMADAGASNFDVTESWEESTVDVDGRPLFVEGVCLVGASGRPDLG
jgi:N-methylhydantoinase A/oxoprolinase/acetone carboxylase beta subunit